LLVRFFIDTKVLPNYKCPIKKALTVWEMEGSAEERSCLSRSMLNLSMFLSVQAWRQCRRWPSILWSPAGPSGTSKTTSPLIGRTTWCR